MSTTFENLLVTTEGAISTITFNRPKALNALNSKTLQELDAAIDQVASSRVVILTGAGEKAFIAGADISEMNGQGPRAATHFSALGHRILRKLEKLDGVTIAAINGFCLGGGLETALACDLLYASDNAVLGLPEVGLGLVPGFGGTQRLARVIGPHRARELTFTAERITAAAAKTYGLVLEVTSKEELLPYVRQQAEKIVAKGPIAVATAKRLVGSGYEVDLDTGLSLENAAFGALFDTSDVKEGLGAFLEKRAPVWTGK